MSLPEPLLLRQDDTHRLIPKIYSDEPYGPLRTIAEDPEHLAALAELDRATDKQVFAENNLLPCISVAELVFGIPHARIVNAAFTHATPLGGRFNGPDRGAWYAGFEIETSQAEIAFHKTVHLRRSESLKMMSSMSITWPISAASFTNCAMTRALGPV